MLGWLVVRIWIKNRDMYVPISVLQRTNHIMMSSQWICRLLSVILQKWEVKYFLPNPQRILIRFHHVQCINTIPAKCISNTNGQWQICLVYCLCDLAEFTNAIIFFQENTTRVNLQFLNFSRFEYLVNTLYDIP